MPVPFGIRYTRERPGQVDLGSARYPFGTIYCTQIVGPDLGGGGAITETRGVWIDNDGSPVIVGTKVLLQIPAACTIRGWTVIARETGSIVFDVKKSTYATYPGTLTSIAGSEKPTLSGAAKAQDLDLTTWTTALAAGDLLEISVESVSGITEVSLFLNLQRA